MRDSKEDSVMQAYALVGRAAADFATLEFHLQFLTSFLATGKRLSPEAVILTRRYTFSDKIQLIREITPFRFPKDSPIRQCLSNLASDLDTLRERRNFFIHGYWLINWQLIYSEGLIRCSDPKWRFDKKTEGWTSMQSHDITFEDLENLIRKIASTIGETHNALSMIEEWEKASKEG
jgi:hypothetical protein